MSEVYSLNWHTMVTILLVVSLLAYFIRQIYDMNHRGKLVLKICKRNAMVIFWIVIIFICCLFLFNDIKSLNQYKEILHLSNNARGDVNEIRSAIEASYYDLSDNAKYNAINQICMIGLSILFIIDAIRYSDIRENGIYLRNTFCKWSKIRSYSFICTNTMTNSTAIQFEIETLFKKNRKIELDVEITENQKLNINKVLDKYIK